MDLTTTSPENAVEHIQSGDRVFIHSVAAAPQQLIKAMTARGPELQDVEIIQLHTEGKAPYADPEYRIVFSLMLYLWEGQPCRWA